MKSKVVQKRAQERNQDLRDAWRTKLLEWRAHQLVFLDESAINEHILQRRRGWAPIGATASVIWPFKRSERWSILSAYTEEGFITHDVTMVALTLKCSTTLLRIIFYLSVILSPELGVLSYLI